MPYPNEVDKFNEKLNKNDALYVIEEVVTPVGGVYENILAHDNIVDSSVRVYTGSKLTGDRIDNFILSIPADMDWKRIIKIFSTAPTVYVTYETYGDQVESEDINRLQDSMSSTQKEVDRYKEANDLVVTNTVNRVTTVENNKAEKTYVDTELLKKSDKANTYTKTETDSRIQAVVDAAPAALDTLNEIAAALNDDPNFAATMTTELTKKVDKVNGKQLSTEDYSTSEKTKLVGIETGANKYIHPSTHPATMIVEDTTHRFVSDADKTNWNGKLNATDNAVSASKLQTGRTIALSGDVTGSAVFDGSANVIITATVADDSHAHIIANVDGLQAALDAKETPAGAQLKVNTHANRTDNPHSVTKAQVSLGNVDDVQQATKAEFNTHNGDNTRHITAAERTNWNAKSNLALGETSVTAYRGDRGKVAYDHSQLAHAPSNAQKNSDITKAEIEAKLIGDITTHAHNQYVTQNQLGSAGYGDMLKSVYDSDGDGVVDAAESVPWDGVTGKPTTFAPSTHNHAWTEITSKPSTFSPSEHSHDHIIGDDTRDSNYSPNDYMATGVRYKGKTSMQVEFKNITAIGLSGILTGTYCFVETYTPWTDSSGGYPIQLAYGNGGMCFRVGVSGTAWGPWESILTNKKAKTWNDLKGV